MLALSIQLVAQDERSENVQDRVLGLAIGDDGSIYCAGYSQQEFPGARARACVCVCVRVRDLFQVCCRFFSSLFERVGVGNVTPP